MVHLVCFHFLIEEEITLNVQMLIILCFGVQQPIIIQLIADGETVCQTVGWLISTTVEYVFFRSNAFHIGSFEFSLVTKK